jgi:hypothetical protein
MCIAACKGVISKVLSPFPDALKSYQDALDRQAKKFNPNKKI